MPTDVRPRKLSPVLLLDEANAFRVVIVIISELDRRVLGENEFAE